MLSDSSVKLCVTGKQEKKRGNRLEVLCILTIKVLKHMHDKVETIIKDVCGILVWRHSIIMFTLRGGGEGYVNANVHI